MNDNLLTQALLITLVAFIGYMHCYIGSTMMNRPIIMAPLVGLVLGDLTLGVASWSITRTYILRSRTYWCK